MGCRLLLFSLLASVGISYADKEEKALILYFDYSENIDTTGLDADAVSQASMAGTAPGTPATCW